MAHDFDVRYDRRLTPEFLAHFCEGGFASSLATITKSGLYPLDLRTRRDAKGGSEHVTLYTGLTAVLQVLSSKNGTIRLAAHSTHQKQGTFDKAWQTARTVEEWTTLWPEVELYLERVIPTASQSHGRTEGAVQAAIGSYRDGSRLVLDREVTPSFRDSKLKKKVMDECRDPILEALKAADLGFSGMPKTLGNECDALAISSDGTLEAIEVKPLRGGSIAWVAAQALMYSRLMATWIEYVADEPEQVPGRVLREMAEQRAAMGLAPRAVPTLPDRPTVIPVVAVQRGASPTMVSRMLAVRDALAASEHGFPRVQIFEVSLIGELIELDGSRTATGKPRPLVAPWAARHNAAVQEWKARTPTLPDEARGPGTVKNRAGKEVDVDYALPREHASLNLLPEVRATGLEIFSALEIPWHQGRDGGPSPHLRSSQVQCVNALAQMIKDPDRIEAAFGSVLDIATVRDLGEVHPSESGRFLTFEYIGPTDKDYLSEGRRGKKTRGSQCTSVDAAFAYRTSAGVDELALVEWKFTETYPSADHGADRKLKGRTKRYGHLLADPDSPIDVGDVEIGDLFHEPVYQLVRQQLLAWQLETDPDVAAERVRVVHVLSPENLAYERSYRAPSLAPLGDDVSQAWQRLLRRPDRFVKLDPAVFLDPAITSDEYVDRYRLGTND